MIVYHLTSIAWTGYIEFVFNDNQLLESWSNHAILSEGQHIYLVKHLPREIAELDNIKTEFTTLTEMKENITFDIFWIRYDDKINSSKKKTLIKWNKMTPADRARAFHFIPRYFANIPFGTRKKYAGTYLNDELWNN
jgi:hypothetical protein